ncbi:MAG: hypothetical protein M3Q26_06285 [Acidobacteriota bacterium]|nr:hypothetical protein [Acidobacteriota bacterium]
MRDYSDAAMPHVEFYYDGKDRDINNILQTATGSAKGKTTGVKPSVSRTNSTNFDAMGGLLTSQQITDCQTYNFSQHGRFTSVDPLTASATIRNTQTFKRFCCGNTRRSFTYSGWTQQSRI